jgi:hypothetical protein
MSASAARKEMFCYLFGGLDAEGPGNQICLDPQGTERILLPGKSKHINGVARTEEIEPSAHRAASGYEFEIVDSAGEMAAEILFPACYEATHKLKAGLFFANNVAHRDVSTLGDLSDLEMAVLSIDEDVFNVWICRRGLCDHLPFLIRQLKSVISIRIGKRSILRIRDRDQSAGHYEEK